MSIPRRRAALYARFSTELQNDKSVDDQLDLCAAFAKAQGFTVVEQHHDRAKSGTTTRDRDGLSCLLEGARAGHFDVVVVEALDRLSRDQEDLAGLHKRLSFQGVQIIAVHDGIVDQLQVGIRGLMSALFITDLKQKIRRGMGGVVADGRTAGGRAYGYRPVPGRPGEPKINEAEAETVRRIYTAYAAGQAPREIAAKLNDDGVPPPRKGSTWNASTINGSPSRQNGILHNPNYAGEIVWNRVQMMRNPDTGKRVSRSNPVSEWRRAAAPHLRIVPPELWEAVQARKSERAHDPGLRRGGPAKRLLSGLLRCGHCGGGLSMHDKAGTAIRVRCSTQKESGSCQNRARYRLDLIERAVIEALVERLGQPDAARSWLEAVQSTERNDAVKRAKAERVLKSAQAKVDRLQKNLVEGRIDTDFFDREIISARADLEAQKRVLAAVPKGNVVSLHPAALDEMAEVLAILAEHLPTIDPTEDREAFDALRSLIKKVVVLDRPDGGIDCEITGTIAPLILPQQTGGVSGSGGGT